MAESNSTASNIEIVKSKINQLTLDLIAIHEISIDSFEEPQATHYQTTLQRMTEMCARELEKCSDLLGSNNGCATAHFDRFNCYGVS